jgi:hypothetical protein
MQAVNVAHFQLQPTWSVFQAVLWTGWALSTGMTFILVHGLYGNLGPIMSAAYVALSHTAWAIAVAWIVIACSTRNGGQHLTLSLLVTCVHGKYGRPYHDTPTLPTRVHV